MCHFSILQKSNSLKRCENFISNLNSWHMVILKWKFSKNSVKKFAPNKTSAARRDYAHMRSYNFYLLFFSRPTTNYSTPKQSTPIFAVSLQKCSPSHNLLFTPFFLHTNKNFLFLRAPARPAFSLFIQTFNLFDPLYT